MYLKSKKLVSSFHMLDYKLKIDKPDKKAKKKKLFSFTWRRLRKSKAEGSHSQTELGFGEGGGRNVRDPLISSK